MSSVSDVIEEESWRLVEYLDIDKIVESKNPYEEFLKQVEKEFGQGRGLNFLSKTVDKYKELNILFKDPAIQDRLPKEFEGSLKRKEVKTFWEKRDERIEEKIRKEEKRIKKKPPIKRFDWKEKEERYKRFIIKRKDVKLSTLFFEFNKVFGTNVSKNAIRDKRLRFLGKKK